MLPCLEDITAIVPRSTTRSWSDSMTFSGASAFVLLTSFWRNLATKPMRTIHRSGPCRWIGDWRSMWRTPRSDRRRVALPCSLEDAPTTTCLEWEECVAHGRSSHASGDLHWRRGKIATATSDNVDDWRGGNPPSGKKTARRAIRQSQTVDQRIVISMGHVGMVLHAHDLADSRVRRPTCAGSRCSARYVARVPALEVSEHHQRCIH